MDLSKLGGAGKVVIGASIYFAEGVPADYTAEGARYLLGGMVETDTSKFSQSVFTSNLLVTTNRDISAIFGSENVAALAYSGALYVVVSSAGKIATSPDGITWTQRNVPTPSDFTSGTYAGFINGLFFIGGAGNSNRRLYTSPDGITWTERNVAFSVTNVAVTGVAFNGSRYVAVSVSGHRSYSDNLTSWTAAGTNSIGASGIAYGNGVFVHDSNTSTAEVYTSPDGIEWTVRTIPQSCGAGIAFGHGAFIIVGQTGRICRSVDGIAWTIISSAGQNLQKITFAYNAFFITGATNTFIRSLNGLSFDTLTTTNISGNCIAAASATEVLVGANSAALRKIVVTPFAGARSASTVGGTRMYVRIS